MKRLLCLIIPVFCCCLSFAQEKTLVDKAKLGYRISNAELEMQDRNFRGAIAMIRDILKDYPGDPKSYYLLAQCYYEVKNYWVARNYIDSSLVAGPAEDPEHLLIAGKVYHSVAELDKAEIYYQKFRKAKKEGFLFEGELEKFLGELEYAKEQMAKPKNINVKPLGQILNSQYDDYAPSVSSDGSVMYFTTRRPHGMDGGQIDEKGDYKYFEDIYESHRNDGKWGQASRVEGPLNTEKYDAVLSLAPDGSEMYVYVNNGKNGGDIYSSHKGGDGLWAAPEALPSPINTSYYEGSLSVTADGNTYYFISERTKGFGFGDIWRVTKVSATQWGQPENLGPAINTPYDEKFVFIHPDGKTLFFASNGHEGLGSYDIFRVTIVGDQFTSPVNLGYPINTVNEESTLSLTSDNKTMYLASVRKEGMGERDIYEIDISGLSLLEAGVADNNKGLVVGTIVTEGAKKISDAIIDIYEDGVEEKILSLTSDASGRYEAKLPLGKVYVLKVNAPDFGEGTEKINVKPGVDGKSITVKHVVLKAPTKTMKAPKEGDEEKEEEPEEDEE